MVRELAVGCLPPADKRHGQSSRHLSVEGCSPLPPSGSTPTCTKKIAVPGIGPQGGAKVWRSVLVSDDIGETIFKWADVDVGCAETYEPPFLAASERDADRSRVVATGNRVARWQRCADIDPEGGRLR